MPDISTRLLLAAVLLFGAQGMAAVNQPVEPRVTLETNEGFCPNGATIPLVPSADDAPQLNTWGSFCSLGRKKPAMARTSAFSAPQYLRIYLIGYNSPTLALQRVSDGARYILQPYIQEDRRWVSFDYRLPADWQGKQVRLVAEGNAEQTPWRGFSEPISGSGQVHLGDAVSLLALTSLHFSAIMICALLPTVVAVWRGLRDTIQAGLITLAGAAAPGYCMFWLNLYSSRWGHYGAVLIIIGSLAGLLVSIRKLDSAGLAVLRPLVCPLLLVGVAALLVVSSGFLYGGLSESLSVPRVRFSHLLPNDNLIPLKLAEGDRKEHMPVPLDGDWLSSDRPPLQAGIVLAQFPLFRQPRELGYTIVSVLAQSLWIFALWLLLAAFKLNPRVIGLALAACLFSGFVFLNSFYVWPKLLAAAYVLGFFAAFVTSKPVCLSWLEFCIVPGALLSFSLLAHGGSMFGLITIIPLVLFFRRPWPVKRLLASAALAFVLYLPWVLYQKLYDPPGNRLLKWHLAGVVPVDKRDFLETIEASYSKLTFGQIVAYKKQNFEQVFGGGWRNMGEIALFLKKVISPHALSTAAANASWLRIEWFLSFSCSLGLFIFAPYALLAGIAKRFRSAEWRVACMLWGLVFVSLAIWCVLMFGPGATSIHQGAYSTVLLAIAGSVLSLWALSARLAMTIVLLQIGMNVLMYGPLVRVPYVNGELPDGILHPDTLLLCFLSLAAVLAIFCNLAQLRAKGIEQADAIAPTMGSSVNRSIAFP